MTMEMEKANHKELVPLAHYLEAYREADPMEISERTRFPYDTAGHHFTVTYLGRPYEVSWPLFQIRCLDEKTAYSPLLETNQSKILLVRFLLEGAAVPESGRFLTYREVPWGEVYYRQFSGRCLARLAFSYGGHLEEYRRKMESLGAVNIPESDAGYQYEIFPGFSVRFLLWEGDEEFPPSSQILFSDNFVAAFHPEDLVVVSEVVIGALKRL